MKTRLLPKKVVIPLTVITVNAMIVHAVYSLIISPADDLQGDAVRLLYVHVPAAWLAYVSFAVTTLCSILYLIPKTRNPVYDILAGASARAGVIFCALTLLLGALWGKPVWGVYWAWDARITATAVLLFLYIGYLAIRSLSPTEQAKKRNAWFALFAFIDVPIVHFSVNWWRTLHQQATVLNPNLKAEISGTMATSLWTGVIAFSLLYVVMVDRQFRRDSILSQNASSDLDDQIKERIAQAEQMSGAAK
ncbi:MAG TPA: cytochrome c biogenesis protein CcsA [Acidimicrobiia bacterium]|nr:cytochrome c biogenesis protein CcsA [Acidimicrobiia bacterium]